LGGFANGIGGRGPIDDGEDLVGILGIRGRRSYHTCSLGDVPGECDF
jgi:hypothetical protein